MNNRTHVDGREVATSLNMVYEMLSSMKRISKNKLVWELPDKLEEAHKTERN